MFLQSNAIQAGVKQQVICEKLLSGFIPLHLEAGKEERVMCMESLGWVDVLVSLGEILQRK